MCAAVSSILFIYTLPRRGFDRRSTQAELQTQAEAALKKLKAEEKKQRVLAKQLKKAEEEQRAATAAWRACQFGPRRTKAQKARADRLFQAHKEAQATVHQLRPAVEAGKIALKRLRKAKNDLDRELQGLAPFANPEPPAHPVPVTPADPRIEQHVRNVDCTPLLERHKLVFAVADPGLVYDGVWARQTAMDCVAAVHRYNYWAPVLLHPDTAAQPTEPPPPPPTLPTPLVSSAARTATVSFLRHNNKRRGRQLHGKPSTPANASVAKTRWAYPRCVCCSCARFPPAHAPPDLAGDHVVGRSTAQAAQEALVRIEANSLKIATTTDTINQAMDTYVLRLVHPFRLSCLYLLYCSRWIAFSSEYPCVVEDDPYTLAGTQTTAGTG